MSKARSKWIPFTLVVVVVIAVVVGYVILQTPGFLKPKEVLLSGNVVTTGIGTSPEKITFTSMRDGKTYVALITDGKYSVSLPNADSYKVTVTWTFLGVFTGGTSDAGTLNLDIYQSQITRNWAG